MGRLTGLSVENQFPTNPIVYTLETCCSPLIGGVGRHCLDRPYVDHYKLIDDNNDSFDQIQSIEFPLTSRRIQHFELIGSANGLFSLHEHEHFILWNPSIRKFSTLPKPCITVKTHGKVANRIAFGFDPRTNDYKVVRIAFPDRKPPLIEIYSLNEGSWRITSAPFPPGIGFSDWTRPAASLNGAVHFAVYDKNKPSGPLVLSFELGDEVFRLISLPNGAFGWGDVQTSVIGGSLSLLCYDTRKNTVNKCCSIWVMKEYGVVDSWTKQFTINLNGGKIIRVLGLQGNGNILVEAKEPIGWELSSYDPKSEQVKNLGICGRPYYFCVDNYMENLVLLNRPNDTVSKRRVSRKRKCRVTSDEEERVLQKARHLLQEAIQGEESECQFQQKIVHHHEAIIHIQETMLMTLQGAMTRDERVCQRQEAFLCKQVTILQQQMEKIATLISKMEKMDTVKSKVVFIIQELRGQAEVETILQQQMEKITFLKSQLERMYTIKSKVLFLIQQFRGQAGDMFSGAGDQSLTQVQQRSSSAGQEM
nr:f-box protein [Quercus suber]